MTVPTAAQLTGGNARGVKFEAPGDTIEGQILSQKVQQVTKPDGTPDFFRSGDPKWQILISLQTKLRDDADDDGIRTLYCKSFMMPAVRQAVQTAGAPELEDGGWLSVTFTHEGEKTSSAYSAPKMFTAEYKRPGPSPAEALGVTPQTAAPQHKPEVLAALKAANIDPTTIPVQ